MHTGTNYATIATSITITTAKHHLLKLNTHPLTASYPVCFRLTTSACEISTSELMTKITTTRKKKDTHSSCVAVWLEQHRLAHNPVKREEDPYGLSSESLDPPGRCRVTYSSVML